MRVSMSLFALDSAADDVVAIEAAIEKRYQAARSNPDNYTASGDYVGFGDVDFSE